MKSSAAGVENRRREESGEDGQLQLPPGWIRVRLPIDVDAIAGYLMKTVPDFGTSLSGGPVQILQSDNGMSNPTYMLWREKTPHKKYVVRKKPPGKLLPSAHQVEREYRAMKALEGKIPVPKCHVLCEDTSFLGVPFYVMDFVEGRVLDDDRLAGWTPDDRSALYADMVDVLAKLHSVDPASVGLGKHGKSGNYAFRQLKTWGRMYDMADPTIEANKTKHDYAPEVLAMGSDMRRLARELKILAETAVNEETTIVHGDYRLGNLMLHPQKPEIVAVLDWEISTLGHPLSDLAYCMSPWETPGVFLPGGVEEGFLPQGVPSEDEFIAAYCNKRGIQRFSQREWEFWKALNWFRKAAIVHGVYARALAGNAGSSSALQKGYLFTFCVERGLVSLGMTPGAPKL